MINYRRLPPWGGCVSVMKIERCVTMAKEYRLSAERLEELKQELTYLQASSTDIPL